MKRWLLLFFYCFIITIAFSQEDYNRIPYYAKIPSNWYVQLQTGVAVPSIQDLKLSRLHYLGMGFPLSSGIGFNNKKHAAEFNFGFYGSSIQGLNSGNARAVTYRMISDITYQQYQKRLSKKNKIHWWTGGMIDAFYDFRNDRELTNNRNLELFVTNISWVNTFEKSIKIKNQPIDLYWQVALPIFGGVGESQSYTVNTPQNSLFNGIFNYQDYNPQIFQNLRWLPLGGFIRLQSTFGAFRTFEFKNKKVDLGIEYDWNFFNYSQTRGYGITTTSHQILLTAKYYLLKINPND